MIIDLTDFTRDELNTLVSAITNYMLDQSSQMCHYERYHLDTTAPFSATYNRARVQVMNCQALNIQALNALHIVSQREIVNAN